MITHKERIESNTNLMRKLYVCVCVRCPYFRYVILIIFDFFRLPNCTFRIVQKEFRFVFFCCRHVQFNNFVEYQILFFIIWFNLDWFSCSIQIKSIWIYIYFSIESSSSFSGDGNIINHWHLDNNNNNKIFPYYLWKFIPIR